MTAETAALADVRRSARISLPRMLEAARKRPNDGTHGWHPVVWDATSLLEPGRDTRVLLTLDMGAHGCGWWRNSDYDRCYHLSISHPIVDHESAAPPSRLEPPSDAEVAEWSKLAFPQHYRWTWTEPPASALSIDVLLERRRPGVAHVRLFLDKQNRPILPEGEVYTLKPWADGTSPEKVFRS